jgi:colanic acid biosynthesis glycosyl transferase WcaI
MSDPGRRPALSILVVSQYFWPESFRINEIVAGLTARGHTVTVLTNPPNYPEGQFHPQWRADPTRFANYEGAEIIRVPVVPRGRSKLPLLLNYLSFVVFGALIGAWRLRGRRFDCILAFQGSPVTSVIPAIVQRRLKGVPLATWIVDLWPETLAAVGMVTAPSRLALVSRLVSWIYARTDLILVQSHMFDASVRRHHASADVRYFPAWAEATFEGHDQDIQPAPELAPYADTFNVVFAGNLGEGQDLLTVLAAADRVRDQAGIRWIIVGDGRAAPALRAGIAALGLADRVIMLGRFPVERMPEFFKAADALLVSLKPEPVFAMTIPGKVQSYMRAGRPVVAMLDGEGARVIAEAGCGLVVPAGDAAGLAQAVQQLAAMSTTERAALGTAGRIACARDFDRTTLLNRLDDWLITLAASRRGVGTL